MSTIPKLRHSIAARSLLEDPLLVCMHSTPPFRACHSRSLNGPALFYMPEKPPLKLSVNYRTMSDGQPTKRLLRQPISLRNIPHSTSTSSKSSVKQFLDHMSQPLASWPFRSSSRHFPRFDSSRKTLSHTGVGVHPCASFTSLTSSAPSGGLAGEIFPYSDAENLDFNRCKNPAQLEKSIESYLKSHPEPTEHALVAMLAACANLIKATGFPSDRERGNQMNPAPSGHKKHKSKMTSQKTRTDNFRSNLLQTILGSFEFTPEDVFKIATSVYYDIPAGLYHSKERSDTIVRAKPSLDVTNAFLHVCAVSGHFDQAWLVMEDMMHRTQGDFKPDLATYRHVLKAAAAQRRKLASQSLDVADVDTKVGEIIDYAADSLSKQSRVALWVKLSLGGLVGATVGKFTMMGILALPSSSIFSGATEPLGEQSMITSSQQPEGIIHLLASHEVALGIGFVTGLLTAGYYIRGSTQKPRVNTEEQVKKSRGQYSREDLPHARLFGLYFPDLKTTDKEEIREYLRKDAEV